MQAVVYELEREADKLHRQSNASPKVPYPLKHSSIQEKQKIKTGPHFLPALCSKTISNPPTSEVIQSVPQKMTGEELAHIDLSVLILEIERLFAEACETLEESKKPITSFGKINDTYA